MNEVVVVPSETEATEPLKHSIVMYHFVVAFACVIGIVIVETVDPTSPKYCGLAVLAILFTTFVTMALDGDAAL